MLWGECTDLKRRFFNPFFKIVTFWIWWNKQKDTYVYILLNWLKIHFRRCIRYKSVMIIVYLSHPYRSHTLWIHMQVIHFKPARENSKFLFLLFYVWMYISCRWILHICSIYPNIYSLYNYIFIFVAQPLLYIFNIYLSNAKRWCRYFLQMVMIAIFSWSCKKKNGHAW